MHALFLTAFVLWIQAKSSTHTHFTSLAIFIIVATVSILNNHFQQYYDIVKCLTCMQLATVLPIIYRLYYTLLQVIILHIIAQNLAE